jgi:hypothetical protein
MRLFLATVLVVAIGTTAVGAGMALAGDVEVSPDTPAEGTAELTLDVTEFEPGTPIYAVPCEVPADGEDLDVTTDSCDIAAVATATTDGSGRATIVVDWDIPSDGIAVYVSDEARDHEATQILTPEVGDAAPDSPDVAVLGTNVVQEDLAETGPRELKILTMLATAIIGLGFALCGAERRLATV